MRDPDQQPDRPDICIGTDEFHTPKDLIDFSVDYFQNKGYRVKLNSPYSGTIVPLEYYRNDNRVKSIMVEVNRKLYLRDGGNEQSDEYQKTRKAVQEYIRMLRSTGIIPLFSE